VFGWEDRNVGKKNDAFAIVYYALFTKINHLERQMTNKSF
jgi:hypothetical protein